MQRRFLPRLLDSAVLDASLQVSDVKLTLSETSMGGEHISSHCETLAGR